MTATGESKGGSFRDFDVTVRRVSKDPPNKAAAAKKGAGDEAALKDRARCQAFHNWALLDRIDR